MSLIRDHLLYVQEAYSGIPEMLSELDALEASVDTLSEAISEAYEQLVAGDVTAARLTLSANQETP